VDLILTHSLRTKRQLEREGIPEWRIKKILHGSYLHLCQPADLPTEEARRLLGISPDANVVLFFGSIEWRKGLDRLVDAFAILARRDRSLYLVISGYPNEDFRPYERRMRELGIRDLVKVNLNWIPYSDMQKYFNAASVVVLPYRRISQSGVIQLAYAYARPVVVTDVGGIGEIVVEDGTGIVAKSESAEDIAEAIQVLLSDPVRAASMGQLGRRLAETKYEWRHIAQQLARFYRAAGTGLTRGLQDASVGTHTWRAP
jgi:glycosyltransferase involved in cell wall biosynthesis